MSEPQTPYAGKPQEAPSEGAFDPHPVTVLAGTFARPAETDERFTYVTRPDPD